MNRTDKYEKTQAFTIARKRLESEGFLCLKGKPGSGKTALAYELMSELSESKSKRAKQCKKEPLILNSTQDLYPYLQRNSNKMILIDDFFGKYGVLDSDVDEFEKYIQNIESTIQRLQNTSGIFMVVTVRSEVFSAITRKKSEITNQRSELQTFLTKHILDLDSVNLSELEQDTLLAHYCSNISLKTIASIPSPPIGLPQICSILSGLEEAQRETFVQNPDEFVVWSLQRDLQTMRERSPLDFAFMCVMFMHGSKCKLDAIRNDQILCEKVIKQMFSLEIINQFGFTNELVIDRALTMSSFYVRRNDNMYGFANDFIQEALAKIILKEEPNLAIKYGTHSFLTKLSFSVPSPFLISTEHEERLISRIQDELKMKCSETFSILAKAKIFQCETFIERMLSEPEFVFWTDENEKSFAAHLLEVAENVSFRKCISLRLHQFDLGKLLKASFQNEELMELILKDEKSLEVVFTLLRDGSIPEYAMTKIMNLVSFETKCQSRVKSEIHTNLLQEACLAGNPSALKRCLEKLRQDASPKVEEDNLLVFGVMGGSTEIVTLLLDKGASLDVRDEKTNDTILHIACCEGLLEMVNLILQVKEELVNYKSSSGQTPIFAAAKYGHIGLLKRLKDVADVGVTDEKGRTILDHACWNAKVETVKYITEHFRNLLHQRSSHGLSALAYAALGGSTSIIEHLVHLGLKLCERDKNLRNILHWACHKLGNTEVVEYLLECNPELCCQLTNDKYYPAHYSICIGDVHMFECLDKHCSYMSTWRQRQSNLNLLQFTCLYCDKPKRVQVLRYLLDKYPELIKERDSLGRNLAHYAAMGGLRFLLEYLSGNGEYILGKDYDGSSVLLGFQECQSAEHMEAIEYIVDHHSSLMTEANNRGVLPIRKAAGTGYNPTLQVFIDRNENLYAEDKDGLNILHYACLSGNLNMIRFILQNVRDLHTKKTKSEELSVLHMAAMSFDLDVLKEILQIMPEKDVKSKSGLNMLDFALCHLDANTDVEKVLSLIKFLHQNQDMHMFFTEKTALCAALSGKVRVFEKIFEIQRKSTRLLKPDVLSIVFEGKTRNREGSTKERKRKREGKFAESEKESYGKENLIHKVCKDGTGTEEDMLEMVTHLVDKYPTLAKDEGEMGKTVLHYAAMGGRVSVFLRLVETFEELDIYKRDCYGWNVLYYASVGWINKRSSKMVEYLISQHPNLLQEPKHVSMPVLHAAAFNGSILAFEKLKSRVGEKRTKGRDKEGATILHRACQNLQTDMVNYILQHYQSLMVTVDKRKRTVLDYTVRQRKSQAKIDIVRLLLSKNSDICKCPKSTKTIYDVALRTQDDELLNVLKETVVLDVNKEK